MSKQRNVMEHFIFFTLTDKIFKHQETLQLKAMAKLVVENATINSRNICSFMFGGTIYTDPPGQSHMYTRPNNYLHPSLIHKAADIIHGKDYEWKMEMTSIKNYITDALSTCNKMSCLRKLLPAGLLYLLPSEGSEEEKAFNRDGEYLIETQIMAFNEKNNKGIIALKRLQMIDIITS